jgi:hypothetical protein
LMSSWLVLMWLARLTKRLAKLSARAASCIRVRQQLVKARLIYCGFKLRVAVLRIIDSPDFGQ